MLEIDGDATCSASILPPTVDAVVSTRTYVTTLCDCKDAVRTPSVYGAELLWRSVHQPQS